MIKDYMGGLSKKEFSKNFRVVAGSHLAECCFNSNMSEMLDDELCNFLKNNGSADGKEITDTILMDTLSLASGKYQDFINIGAYYLALTKGIKGSQNPSIDVQSRLSEYLGGSTEKNNDILDSHKEKADVKGIVFDDDDLEEDEIVEEVDESGEEVVDETVEPEPEEDLSKKELREAICNYYSAFYDKEDLLRRYSALFASGYEVNKPDGILCTDGIVKVSGHQRVVYEDSVSTAEIYNIIATRFAFVELPNRSIQSVATAIVNEYLSGQMRLLYFPNKLLEFAYGLECPKGENAESLNTYQKHADAQSWTKFKEGELSKALTKTLRGLLYVYVSQSMESLGTTDYKSADIRNGVKDFMSYAKRCLSLCFLFTDYKFAKKDGVKSVSKFVLRICDPTSRLLSINLTNVFIKEAFLGSAGKDPFSYMPRVDTDALLVEYSHEFNHALAQATPIFAFKALESLNRDGKSISWSNLILGKGEDGSILKCGSGLFIDLAKALTHEIDAGSRAGKGVMTLNLLASAIASLKNTFYLDRKPDMASILKFMCQDMFVVNGGGYAAQYDGRGQWGPDMVDGVASLNIPQEALEVFDVRVPNWSDLGDLFYMRALMLAVGIIFARGAGKGTDPEWGGDDGICLIVDEFRVFQSAYRSLLNRAFAKIPNTVLGKSKEQLAKGTISQVEFERCYNDAGYYALSYVNSLAESLQFLVDRRDAGFDESEKRRSDIFIIGQDLYDGPVNVSEFVNSFIQSSASNRYKTMAVGMNSSFGSNICNAETSIPYSMLHFKGTDAFFGRNIDTNYLAQTNPGSKAYGRLDDKASNFAYMPTFTEETRKTLNSGNVGANMSLANNCKYFKPYLILNDYQNSDGSEAGCVTGVYERCFKEAGITREEIIAENHMEGREGELHPAVGFLNYIEMAGISDYSASMAKGGHLAQRVVERLGYQGSWLEFICDLRPEWMFTLKDIVDVSQGHVPDLADPTTNKIHKEWVEFNPGRFGAEYEDPQKLSERINDEFIMDEDGREDFSTDTVFNEADERLANLFDESGINEEDELDLFEDDFEDDIQGTGFGDIQEGDITETGYGDSGKGTKQNSAEIQQLLDVIAQLQARISDLESGNTGVVDNTYQYGGAPEYSSTDSSDLGDSFNGIDYEGDEITSLTQMMTIVSNDVINKFGGFTNFKTLRVIGGSLIVNGYYYRCNIKDFYAKGIPYDIRRKMNAGHIAELFNFNYLLSMSQLREIEIDSLNFAYDYVSKQIGVDNNIGVDVLFKNIPALQVVKIAKKGFKRSDFESGALYNDSNNLYAQASTSSKLAQASESYLKKWSKNSWGITKNIANGWNNHKVLATLGILGAGALTVTTGLAGAGVGAGRKVANSVNTGKAKQQVKGFMSGLKDLLK